ncbi:MAG: PH domain-containing protein [Ardenticatenales bacterium]|nr:PH domain-containing protein [Ardenticatenales bacterium]
MTTPFEPVVGGDEAVGRLHPLTIVFRAGGVLRNAVLATAAGAFAGELAWLWWLVPFFGISLVAEVVGYARYRYRMAPEELIIEEGLLSRSVRTIPYARIQNVDTVQNVLHRLLGVAEVRIETASGQGAEATMRVLGLGEVEALRRFVMARRGGAPIDVPPAQPAPIVQLGPLEIIAHGLTRNQRAALFFAVIGIGLNAVQWSGVGSDWWEHVAPANVIGWYGRLFRLDELGLVWLAVAMGIALLAALVAVLTVIGALWTAAQLWHFTLTRDGEDLRARYGLFTRHVATIPRFRIQSVAIWDSPFYRWLDRIAVSVETAGGGKPGEGNAAGKRTWLAPIWPRERLDALLAEVQPGFDAGALAWRGVHPGAAGRMRRRGWFVTALVASGLAAIGWAAVPFARWLGPAALIVLGGWTVLDAPRTAAGLGWALTGDVFAVRNGWIRRTVAFARLGKIQSVSLHASPFDRRAGMASVRIDTAGRTDGEHALVVPFLARSDAEALRDALSAAAAQAVAAVARA